MNDKNDKPKKKTVTHKKVKVVGTKQFIDPTTNEIENFQVLSVEERDFNFHKIWLKHILETIDLIGNTKTKLAFWIIDHINYENVLVYTYKRIHEETKISIDTIRVTMKILLESGFLRRINQGAYKVNPDYIFKGNHANRMNVLIQYSKITDSSKANDRATEYLKSTQQLFEDRLNEKLNTSSIEEIEELQKRLAQLKAQKLLQNLSA